MDNEQVKKKKTQPYTPKKKIANSRGMNKRYAEQTTAALRDGFEKASTAITAWQHGKYVLIDVKELVRLRRIEKLMK